MLATPFPEYRHQLLKKNEVSDTERKKTPTLQLCLLNRDILQEKLKSVIASG